jgi:hypothetical protein
VHRCKVQTITLWKYVTNTITLFCCVCNNNIHQITFQDVFAVLLDFSEVSSFLTCVAVYIGHITGASISEELAAFIFTVVSSDYPEDGSMRL